MLTTLVTVPGASLLCAHHVDEPANVTQVDLACGQMPERRDDVLLHPLPVQADRSHRAALLRVTVCDAALEMLHPLLREVGHGHHRGTR